MVSLLCLSLSLMNEFIEYLQTLHPFSPSKIKPMTSIGSSWDNKITTLPISRLKLGKESENNVLEVEFHTLDHNSML